MPAQKTWLQQALEAVTPSPEHQQQIKSAIRVVAPVYLQPDLIAQARAGAVEGTVANSADNNSAQIGGYRPAIFDLPGSLGYIGKTVGHAIAPSYVDAPAENGYLGNSMRRANTASERTNTTLGVQAPTNAVESAARVIGNFALPTGEIGAASKLGKVAKVAAEMIIPGRQGMGAKGVAAATGIGVGLHEGIDALVDDPNYHSVADNFRSGSPQATPTVNKDQQAPVDTDAAFDEALMGTPKEIAPPSFEHQLLNEDSQAGEESKQSGWLTAAEVLAGGAIAFGLGKVAKNLIQNAPAVPLDLATVIGTKNVESRGSKVVAAAFDQKAPIRTNANLFLTPDFAKQYGYKLDTLSNQSIGAQVRHFVSTGQAPNATRQYTPIANVLEPLAQELKPEQQTMLGDALLFGTSLDDLKRSGTQASFNDVTPDTMRNTIAFVKADPTMSKHFDAVQASYKDLLDYEVAIGRRSVADAAQFANANPNYVPMTRDITKDVNGINTFVSTPSDANRSMQDSLARNIAEERAGVQKGAVRNPIDTLANSWRDAIEFGRKNELRYNGLEEFAGSGAKTLDGKPLVYRLPAGETPKGEALNVHTVMENGVPVHYQVNDPALDQAFRFKSRMTIKPLEAWRQTFQSLTTGTIGSLTSGFQFAVSPIYDTQIGMLLRPKEVHLGLINEALSKVNGSIGRFDPTASLGTYTGALRYMWDDMSRAASSNLTNQLMRDNSFLRDTIGDKAVTALRDKFQQSYETSTKALGEDLGIFSHTMHSSPDGLTVGTGVDDLAPTFARAQAVRVAQQAAAQPEWYKGVLASSKVPWVAMRTTAVARGLQTVTEAMHNGFKYSALAANKSKLQDMDQLASNMRRISVDSAGHGDSNWLNAATSSTNYANLTLQTFYEVGRRAKEDPVTFGTNLIQVLGGLTALAYTAQAYDPEVQARHQAKSPEQRSRAVSLWGGAELPVEPILRAPWGLFSTYMDHVSGAADGMYDPAFIGQFDSWFEADPEALGSDLGRVAASAFKDNNPYSIAQNPLLATAAAYNGVVPNMDNRLDGTPAAPKTQTVSGFDTDKKFVGSLMSAYHENVLTTALGSFSQDILRMSDEVYRAAGHYNGPMDAWHTVAAQWKDRAAQGSKVFKPILFGQYENVQSAMDTNAALVQSRDAGIKAVDGVYKKDVMAEALQGASLDPRYGSIIEDGAYNLDPKYIGTPVQMIGQYTKTLQSQIKDFDKQINTLNNEGQRVQADTQTPLEQRNHTVNGLIEKRKALNYQKLMYIRQMEDSISTAIGKHFTYDGFNPDDYLQPTAPGQ